MFRVIKLGCLSLGARTALVVMEGQQGAAWPQALSLDLSAVGASHGCEEGMLGSRMGPASMPTSAEQFVTSLLLFLCIHAACSSRPDDSAREQAGALQLMPCGRSPKHMLAGTGGGGPCNPEAQPQEWGQSARAQQSARSSRACSSHEKRSMRHSAGSAGRQACRQRRAAGIVPPPLLSALPWLLLLLMAGWLTGPASAQLEPNYPNLYVV